MNITPLTLSEAFVFVNNIHRHHPAPQGGLFAIAVSEKEKVVGVAIVGRPVARHNSDSWTVEITRVAVMEGYPNACSMLYGACWRAARAMGYKKAITYTLDTEKGTSVKAAGWKCVGQTKGGSWNVPSRPRIDKHPLQKKFKWEKVA
tara:strand:+ start:2019 stop:2459 length:441 start_codon:yes stop_codon:yes gene_type:complete